MFHRKDKATHIAVIAPFLQGDYMGEILNQIRHICELKHYRFTAIRTNGFGEYNLGVALENYDGVIVIRNAANPKLIEKIQNRGIPVLAVAHDYFPLDVPVIACDNAAGTELAYKYLRAKGHKELLFVGDITQYDLRKRYEHFVELMRADNLPCGTEQIICAPDTLFAGGQSAGTEFIQRMSRATGVICGAGYTALGFIKQVQDSGVRCPGDIDVIAFDSISLMKVFNPELAFIDQNLDVLANRSVTTLESMIHSSTLPTRAITIAPTLCEVQVDENFCELATAKASLNNTHYTNALINNSFEMTQDIVDTRLDKIMSVAPLFSQFMDYGLLSCLVYDRHRRAHLHVHKIFEHTETTIIGGSNRNYTCPPENFPPKAIRDKFTNFCDTCVHFPIITHGELWGVLSFYGKQSKAHSVSSFTSFTGFIDNVTFGYSKVLEIAELSEQLKKSEAEAPHINRVSSTHSTLPSFEWDLEKGSVHWSDIALELLGFTTELEKNIYRKMEIFDRVHPEDEHKLRKELTASLSKLGTMTTAARLKNAEGDYRYYSLQGEILHEEDSRAVRYRCCLSLIN